MLPKRLDRTPIYESNWINLYIDKVIFPSGQIIEKFHQLDYPFEAVVVLVANVRDEVCLIKSLRYTTQSVQWELPAGRIEENENTLTAAKREFSEETGLTAASVKHVYSFNPSPSMSNQTIHVAFGYCSNLAQENFNRDETESVHWVPQNKIRQMITEKEITDGISLLPLLLYFCNFAIPEGKSTF